MSINGMVLNQGQEQDGFRTQMQAFANWKGDLTKRIRDFQDWLGQHQLNSPEIDLRIYDALRSLESDQLNIAFVAEFSRGKTELINAIFFADYGRRLLPSEAGRTTMCPTELFYDRDSGDSYIKLLPIETRLSDISLSDLKKEDSYWTTFPLNVDSPDQMAQTFHEVVKTKRVPVEDAEKLGLYIDELTNGEQDGNRRIKPETVEIPVWRHALISFPHPLLQQGLVILDTPGMNALGSEPELTINMLPSAQAVLFVLSADTGVTKSDLDVWQNYIMAYRNKGQKGLVAVLNKIDTLWDEMKKPEQVEATIREQCRSSAELLGIDTGYVFPISAHKALVAKIRGNAELLEKSNLPALESLLGNEILPDRQGVIWDNIVARLGRSMDDIYAPLTAQLDDLSGRINELQAMRVNNEDIVQQLLHKAKEKKDSYYESVKTFQLSRKKLALQAKIMFNTLDIDSIDKIIDRSRKDMAGSWTTAGMKNGMAVFFDSMRDAMQIVSRQSEETFKLVQAIYKKFHDEYGLRVSSPRLFPTKKYIDELDLLYLKAEEFRNSPVTTMSEQSFVVKKFFISLVSHARNIFIQASKEADTWLKELVNPLVNQIQEKRNSIEQHMKTLSKIRESKNNLESQLKEMTTAKAILVEQTSSLKRMTENLRHCSPPEAAKRLSGEPANPLEEP
ncbi:MAG: dynamin family protein [Gammaproteobacteria bacterium]|nr:dynamin family protein [Gammaproteobacteria bacterium]